MTQSRRRVRDFPNGMPTQGELQYPYPVSPGADAPPLARIYDDVCQLPQL